jgi:hypothetical protein
MLRRKKTGEIMKNLFLTIALLLTINAAQAQDASPEIDNLKNALVKVQEVLDENGISCNINFRPIRNVGRLMINSTLKLTGACIDKNKNSLRAVVKLKINKDNIVIKKLSLTLKNITIPNDK